MTNLRAIVVNGILIRGIMFFACFLMMQLADQYARALPSDDVRPGDDEGVTSDMNRHGYHAETIYDRIDDTDIDAFNFNFVMSFSNGIGLEYPENADISLALRRFYNSRVSYWQKTKCHNRTSLRIRRENPLGLGFELGFGRIIWVLSQGTIGNGLVRDFYVLAYVAPDGSTHKLVPPGGYSETDPSVQPSPPPVTSPTTLYTSKDGSHLMAVRTTAGWKLYFPTGEIREFAHYVAGPFKSDLVAHDQPGGPGCGGDDIPYWEFVDDAHLDANAHDREWVGWYTTRVYNQSDISSSTPSSYGISYHPAPFDYIPFQVTDQFGRQITININTTVGSSDYGLITSIQVPMAPSAAGIARSGVYDFQYQTQTLNITDSFGAKTLSVKLLTSVSMPVLENGDRYIHTYSYTASGETQCGGNPPFSIRSQYIGGQMKSGIL